MSFTVRIFAFACALPLVLAICGNVHAQDRPDSNPLPKHVIESEDNVACRKTGDFIFDKMIADRCVKQQRREYDELLQNGEEAMKLSAELDTAYDKNPNFASEDQKKLDRLEKLFKKIRGSLGAEDDDGELAPDEEKPSTVKAALNNLSERAAGLLGELKKTSRYSISVIAVQSSNALLRLVRFVRFNKK